MQKKVWYKKKRIWISGILILLFITTKLEWAKMRYQKQSLLADISLASKGKLSYNEIKKANSTLHYLSQIYGKELPLLLLLHGSPGSLAAFEDYFKDKILTSRFNLIAVDRLGFGYSDFGKPVSSLKSQSTLIAEILKGFPNQKKIVLGHSLGGSVQARLVMDESDLVDGMIMIAPSISAQHEPSNLWRKMIDFPLIRWITPDALRVCNQEIIPLKEELVMIEENWKDIKIPITIIQGDKDKLVPKENADFAKSAMINNEHVQITMVENGNHFILWSEIPLIIKETIDLLDKLENKTDSNQLQELH